MSHADNTHTHIYILYKAMISFRCSYHKLVFTGIVVIY